MRRRAALLAVAAAPALLRAQPARPVVAVLYPAPQGVVPGPLERFRERLAQLGLRHGRDIELDLHWAMRDAARVAERTAAILQRPPALIVAGTSGSARVALDATRSVPIVMAVSGDPVADGLVASLARPGGNVTGLSIMSPELNRKRVQLLHEAADAPQRFAVLMDGFSRGRDAEVRDYAAAAEQLRVALRVFDTAGPEAYEAAFDAMRGWRAQALLLVQSAVMNQHRARLAELALRYSLPAAAGTGDGAFARSGGLMNYGASIGASWARAADYVQRILAGARPAELPVEQPDRFEFVINRATARTLGLALPQHLLVLADEVIG